jgi:hypothetical protein
MQNRYAILSFLSLFLLNIGTVTAQEEPVFPVPDRIPNQLFYLQRTPNSSTVIYELNYVNGKLDTIVPVHAFWIRYSEHGQRQELSAIQRKFAYGIQSRRIAPDQYELRFLAYKKRVLYLKRAAGEKYEVSTEVNQKNIVLSRIFIKINGGSLFSPNIEYVEFTGRNADTGAPEEERVKIEK